MNHQQRIEIYARWELMYPLTEWKAWMAFTYTYCSRNLDRAAHLACDLADHCYTKMLAELQVK